MKDQEKPEVLIKGFELLAHDIAERIKNIVGCQKSIENSYHEINFALLTTTSSIDNTGTLQFGLIEHILQREARALFESLESLKQSLLASTSDMITHTTAALIEIELDFPADCKCRLNDSKSALTKSLYELKN